MPCHFGTENLVLNLDMAIEEQGRMPFLVLSVGEGKISNKNLEVKTFPWSKGEKRCTLLHTIQEPPLLTGLKYFYFSHTPAKKRSSLSVSYQRTVLFMS